MHYTICIVYYRHIIYKTHYLYVSPGYDSLSWIGHSEGTIQMFAASTLDTSNNLYLKSALDNINLFIALAPVAYVSNERSELIRLLAESDVLYRLMDRGLYEFLPYGPIEKIAPGKINKYQYIYKIYIR